MKYHHALALMPLVMLGACAQVAREQAAPIERTISVVEWNKARLVDLDKVMENYYATLKVVSDQAIRRAVLLRLAALETDKAEDLQARQQPAGGRPDYDKAIHLYQRVLNDYPNDSGNDHVLYQLARAYDLGGNRAETLRALTRLITSYPNTRYLDEAHFRRGELLFGSGSFAQAAAAYTSVITMGEESALYENALYMKGWSLYKAGDARGAFDSFISLLDRKLAGIDTGEPDGVMEQVPEGDQELVADAVRAISLIFFSMEDNTAVARFFSGIGGRVYEDLIYRHLGVFYLEKERFKDAADTYRLFAGRHPMHNEAPLFELNAIDAYKKGKFSLLARSVTQDFVNHYHARSTYWKTHSGHPRRDEIMNRLKSHLMDLAHYYHALAQQSKRPQDYRLAIHWYRIFLASFPDDLQSPGMNFLLAEILFENHQYVQAAVEYEKTAYDYPGYPPDSEYAEAGYAAVLAYREAQRTSAGPGKNDWRRQVADSAMRFAQHNPWDSRTPSVLTEAATDLFAMRDTTRASQLARRVIAITAGSDESELRRTAWTIIAHAAFEQQAFDKAETAYTKALRLTPVDAPQRTSLEENLAASIYKRGERAREAGDLDQAVSQFLRVGETAPHASIRGTAEYDAAGILLAMKDWRRAITVLESFRSAYPQHPLLSEAGKKLAVAYLESGQPYKAAQEFEALAQGDADTQVQREALWEAAELYEKSGHPETALAAYQRYVRRFPQPLVQSIEARQHIALLYGKNGQSALQRYWLKEIIAANHDGGRQSNERTRYLAARAAYLLAEQASGNFHAIRLIEPLKTQLNKKKHAMQAALMAYQEAFAYGIAEISTAATYQIARIYNDFSKALLNSQRPGGLSPEELEQYNILLEEQAYPFEEEAIETYEFNAQRVTAGIYDQWVKQSFADLAILLPARYAKREMNETIIDELD